MSGELADLDGDAAYEAGFTPSVKKPSAREDFANRGSYQDDPPSALVLCTDPATWAEHFIAANESDENGDLMVVTALSIEALASWFEAAMETKRMMSIAALPLPPGLFGRR